MTNMIHIWSYNRDFRILAVDNDHCVTSNLLMLGQLPTAMRFIFKNSLFGVEFGLTVFSIHIFFDNVRRWHGLNDLETNDI